jgi:hypothetical protein
MHDEIDAEGCGLGRGCEALADFVKPDRVALAGARVERGEGADHARLTAADDKIRTGDQEHRRCYCRDGQAVNESVRDWHRNHPERLKKAGRHGLPVESGLN